MAPLADCRITRYNPYMRRVLVVLSVVSLITFASISSQGETASTLNQLLEKVLAAYGGEAALSKVTAFSEKGKVRSSGRDEGSVLRVFQAPDRLRVEVAFPGETPEIRILNGEKGYRNGVSVSGAMYNAMVLQAARFTLPLSLKKSSAVEDLGTADRNGHSYRILRMPLSLQGATLTVEVDEKTGTILRSTGSVPGGPMGALQFVTDYSDFRKVDGVLFAFSETNIAMGQKTAETHLEQIQLLDKVPPETFLPAGAQTLLFLPVFRLLS